MARKKSKGELSNHVPKVDMPDFSRLLFYRTISLKESGIPIPLFTFWRRKGLIDFVDDSKWTKLNYMQLVWLHILISLRDFGLPVEKLKKIHYHFFGRAYEDKFATSHYKQLAVFLQGKITSGKYEEGDKEKLLEIKESLKSDLVMQIHNRDINYFSRLVIQFLNTRQETGIMLFNDGTVGEFADMKYHFFDAEKNEYNSFDHKSEFTPPHIYIPISFFILQFLNNDLIIDYLPGMNILSDDELQIINEMRRPGIKELRIKMDEGKVYRFESDKGGTFSESQSQQIKQLLGIKNYQKITLETRDEKTISFTRTKKNIK